jgi:hypothetical protein
MTTEIWKDISGYEGLCQVSNLGRVKSRKHLKKFEVEKGYLRVNLYKNGKLKKFLVHRLVAQAFHGEGKEGMQVNHINGETKDNRAENLEWTTVKENAQHKTTVLNKKPRGVYKVHGKWAAQIVYDQKKKTIGTFKDKSMAYKAFYDKYLELRGVPPWDLNIYKTHQGGI